jgi:hypothetical protein
MTAYPQKITFGELRETGVEDQHCTHHVTVSANRWPDRVRLSDIELDFVGTAWRQARRGGTAEVLARARGYRLDDRRPC